MRWAWALTVLSAYAAEPGYVDPAACRTCHTQIFESFARTGMGRSFAKAGNVPPLKEIFHEPSKRFYSVVARPDGTYLRRCQEPAANVLEKRIDYVIGSGNHSKTFLGRDAPGRLVELPVSWYSERGGYWAMSPGYDRADHSDFRREVTDSCLFCHNGYPSQGNGGLAMGIDCQRCHGPGEAHVRGRGGIINPAKLSPERQIEVCMQCHLESASRTLPDAIRRFGRAPFSYRPGQPLGDFTLYFDFIRPASEDRITVNNSAYGLLRSKCYQQSGGKLKCTTCHDPHGSEVDPVRACRTCHMESHEAATRNCVGCHMQKRRTEDAVHVVMTDHFIRRLPLKGDLLAPLTERHDRISGPVRLLYPPQAAESALYLAMANGNATDLQSAIDSARPAYGEPYFALGEAFRKSGNVEQAMPAYRRAIALAPDDPRPFTAISALSLERDPNAAVALLQPAVRRMPEELPLLNSLAVLFSRIQKFDDALQLLSKAVQINPEDPLSWLNLGVAFEAKEDLKGAESAYRQALLLQPDLDRASEYLKRVSKN